MAIRPTGAHVVVKRDEMGLPPGYSKPELIIMPETAKARANWGHVVGVGPLVQEVERGDYVAITWFDGTPYDDDILGDVEVFHEDEVLARRVRENEE
jgi:co-chaperonin GroES (HSP10)